jgi:hypothetical protein
MREYLPDGTPMPEAAYVFGNEIGEEMTKHVLRNCWERLRTKATALARETNGAQGAWI